MPGRVLDGNILERDGGGLKTLSCPGTFYLLGKVGEKGETKQSKRKN